MTSKQAVLKLYKNRGETPLECLNRFKNDNPEYNGDKMTYAGRLDPLAEGVLIALVGEECKNKEKYLGMDKEYEVDVLFGFATDTYDPLGKVTNVASDPFVIPAEAGIQVDSINLDSRLRGIDTREVLQSFVGKFSQKYPEYSSKNIKKILEVRNRKNGGLALRRSTATGKGESSIFSEEGEEIPSKEVEIKSIDLLDERTISKDALEKYITDSVNLVKGDFRQKEILESWNSVLDSVIPAEAGIQNLDPCLRRDDKEYLVVSIRVNCTSGTYMRSLANSIGAKVGVPALALNIKRTRIGKYKDLV